MGPVEVGPAISVDELPFLDPDAATYRADPISELRRLRETSWLARDPHGLSVLDYAGCEAALSDTSFELGIVDLLARLGADVAGLDDGGGQISTSEGARHLSLRRAVSPFFTPRRVKEMRADTAQRADALIDAIAAEGAEFEFMERLGRVLPSEMFAEMMGVPPADARLLAEWSSTVTRVFAADPAFVGELLAATRQMAAYVTELIEFKRHHPADDFPSALLAAAAAGTIEPADVASLLSELIGAAADNISNSAGLVFWSLVSDPCQWDRVHEDPTLVATAVDECLRFAPRVQNAVKKTVHDTELQGAPIPAGTLVSLRYLSAHRDPSVFEDPDRLDVGRSLPKPHLNFSVGRHYCVGAALSRMEIEEMLRSAATRWPTLGLSGEASVDDRSNDTWVDHLPLRFERSAR